MIFEFKSNIEYFKIYLILPKQYKDIDLDQGY